METKEIQVSVKDYLTLRQTARATGVKEPTLRRWIRAGIIEGFKNATGSLYYFHKDQLDSIRKLAVPRAIPIEINQNNPFEDLPPLPYDAETGEVLTAIKADEIDDDLDSPTGPGTEIIVTTPSLEQKLLGLSDQAKLQLGERMIWILVDLIK